jgi:DUF4097 and DUF4098 domain-containing protein YvlB
MKRIVILIVLVVLAGIAGVVVRSSSSDSGTVAELRELVSHQASDGVATTVHETFQLAPGARVELGGFNGSVQIETSDTQTADVRIERRASSQDALDRRRINIEADANRLRIRAETMDHNFLAKLFGSKASETVTLKLPRRISLYAKGVNGAFVASEIDGPLQLGGINGKVRVANAADSVTLKGINGNIVVGVKRIGQEGVNLSGINGSIELQLPADINADFDANGINGRVIAEIPNVVVDKGKRRSYWGRIGSGGHGISAKGINGNIRLTRATHSTPATPATD